ncbi:capsular biosynthesis protein [Bacillus sp. FJAT-27225]|uniref:YveK family protein n=1 Tax=Bacillus sp. FJAT-27225 TaxID=1743144 RepID=UPI00080C21EA|nr:Wzz/FepE/Etk N-terminal domain-containing protein [Bacillus sp. FJAT-27225]OCA85953.1 capsular biosynthesis protein [Bacillus sp. FJAT-27225]
MEERFSLREGVKIIRKWMWLILSLTVGSAIIAAILSFFVLKPVYQNSTQFLVVQKNPVPGQVFSENDIRTNVELINTYKAILLSPIILDRVAEELELNLSTEKLAEKVEISSGESSQVVTVLASDHDPEMAAKIANTTVSIFQSEVPELMNVDNVKVISEAKVPSNPQPVSPNKVLNIAVALILGAMAGTGIGFLAENLNNKIKTEEDILQKLKTPVLGVIAHVGKKEMYKDEDSANEKKGVVASVES